MLYGICVSVSFIFHAKSSLKNVWHSFQSYIIRKKFCLLSKFVKYKQHHTEDLPCVILVCYSIF